MEDSEATSPVFDDRSGQSATQMLSSPGLKKIFAYACATGGIGVSRLHIYDLYGVICASEPAASGYTPVQDRFRGKTAFYRAIVREKRRILRQLEWSECIITEGNRRLKILYRDALEVAQKCVSSASAALSPLLRRQYHRYRSC